MKCYEDGVFSSPKELSDILKASSGLIHRILRTPKCPRSRISDRSVIMYEVGEFITLLEDPSVQEDWNTKYNIENLPSLKAAYKKAKATMPEPEPTQEKDKSPISGHTHYTPVDYKIGSKALSNKVDNISLYPEYFQMYHKEVDYFQLVEDAKDKILASMRDHMFLSDVTVDRMPFKFELGEMSPVINMTTYDFENISSCFGFADETNTECSHRCDIFQQCCATRFNILNKVAEGVEDSEIETYRNQILQSLKDQI